MSFAAEVGVRQECVMSPWLFDIFVDGCMREMKSKVVNVGSKLRLNGEVWSVVTCLFADYTVLLAESEGDLLRVVNEFYSVCKRRKLKTNAGKSKEREKEGRNQSINQREHTPGGALRRQPYDAKPEGSCGQVSMQLTHAFYIKSVFFF